MFAQRGWDGPKQFLGRFGSLLQTDGHAAYDQLRGPTMVHACCWSHVERYFKFPVRDYLSATLPGIADVPILRLPELAPGSWALRGALTPIKMG